MAVGFTFANFTEPFTRYPVAQWFRNSLLTTVTTAIIMVPQFRLIATVGLYGNIWAAILPTAAAAFGIFLAIPDELLEAARVGGAGRFRTFISIVLPLSKPLIATLTLVTFMGVRNDFAWPLIVFFGYEQASTLPIELVTDFRGQYSAKCGAIMALTLVMVMPMVVLFLLFQRYFVQGLPRTGIR